MTIPQTSTAAAAPPAKRHSTPADSAATIRAALKSRHGWTSRDVSVRSESFSLGSAVRVTIKRPGVRVADVTAIANGEETIHRCEASGEILGGSNRYVTVTMDYELVRPAATRVKAHLAAIEPGVVFRLAGFRVQTPKEGERFAYVWAEDKAAAGVIGRGDAGDSVQVDPYGLADRLASWLIELDRACTCGAVHDAPYADLASHAEGCGRRPAAALEEACAEVCPGCVDAAERTRAAATVAACLDAGDIAGALHVLEQLEPIAAAAVAVEAFGATSKPAQFRHLLADAAGGATTTNGRSTR